MDCMSRNTAIILVEFGEITAVASQATEIGSHLTPVTAADSVAACAAHATHLWPTTPHSLASPCTTVLSGVISSLCLAWLCI